MAQASSFASFGSARSIHGIHRTSKEESQEGRKTQLLGEREDSNVNRDGIVTEGKIVRNGSGWIFLLLMITNVMVNFDSGGTAAVLVLLDWGCEEKGIQGEEKGEDLGVGDTCHGVQNEGENKKKSDKTDERRLVKSNPDGKKKEDYFPCMTESEKGILGGCPYLGLSIGCPVIGYLFTKLSQKTLVLAMLALNVIATFLFAWVISTPAFYMAKISIGFTQAALCIYSPVWVNNCAPARTKTLWLGLMQGAGAIGAMVGYAVAGYIKAQDDWWWQSAFKFQAFTLAICCVALFFVPREQIDCDTEDAVAEKPEAPHVSAIRARRSSMSNMSLATSFVGDNTGRRNSRLTSLEEQDFPVGNTSVAPTLAEIVEEVFLNPVFMLSSCTLCVLFFVVTGVQFWASMFFSVSYGREDIDVTTTFIAVAGTGPILGVVVGSAIFDSATAPPESNEPLTPLQELSILRLGAWICTGWGLIAAVAGIGAAVIQPICGGEEHANFAFYSAVACIWIQLVFGGGMLPAVTGMALSSVKPKFRTSASSAAMLMYNIFGYMMGSYLPGQVAEWAGKCNSLGKDCAVGKPARMHIAMAVVLASAFLGFLNMGVTSIHASNRYNAAAAAAENLDRSSGNVPKGVTELEPYPRKRESNARAT